MGSYRQILYQVVFRTKSSKRCINKANRQALFEYIAAVLNKRKCICFQVGGVEDHLHLVFALHPTIALSDLIKDVKVSSSLMIKERGLFPEFEAWSSGYSAFTYKYEAKDNLVNYVLNQESHHAKKNFATELRGLCKEHAVEIDERYFMKD